MTKAFAKFSKIYLMMYFSGEYQIMKYFSAMLYQNIVP